MAKRILLVDDEPLIVKGLKYTLEQEGFETDSAADGEEALTKFFSGHFDFILLDTAAGMGAPFTAAATVADRALLVLTPDPVALRDGKIVADRLLAGGRPQSAVRLVMNRVTRDSFGKRASVEDLDECIDTVGAQLIAVIPESVALQQAGAAGTVPPAHDAAVVAGQALAKRLCGQRVPLTF